MSSAYPRGGEKRRILQEMRIRGPEVGTSLPPARPSSPKHEMEQEKRLKREIANSNERRRMQSINSGFEALKAIIPHHDREKLSKAAILQHASEYICQLEQDKAEIIAKNNQLQQMLLEMGGNPQDPALQPQLSPPPKRKKRDTESSDEGIGLTCGDSDEQPQQEDIKREPVELRTRLEPESSHTMEPQPEPKSKPDSDSHGTHIHPKRDLLKKWDRTSELEEAQKSQFSCSPPLSQPSATVSPFLSEVRDVNSCLSLSRRNLDTIVEAIRHLEGDRIMADRLEEPSVPTVCANMRISHSEESGTESSYEDSRSDVSSGRDSPTVSPMECDSSVSVFPPSTSVHVVTPTQTIQLTHHQPGFMLSQHPLHPNHAAYLNQHSEKPQVPFQFLHTSQLPTKCPEMQLPQLLAQPSVIVKRS